jgi:hypothetical protein
MPTPNATKKALIDGSINLSVDTIKVFLLNDSTAYTFDPDRDATVQDVLNNASEFSDTNYSRKTIANQTTSQDNTDDKAVFDGDDLTWTDLGGSQTIQAVVVYKQVGGDDTTSGDDPVLTVLRESDIPELPLNTNGSNVDLPWNSEGILNLA